ncbi:MAG TPA: nuclear transport factor 2 family protein [Planctomycetota bacterium]|jgi:ketosteroid isomerase-like protein|nr:nuclear transport factor 2 family protein [Planctomycetota bacterium]
MKHLAIGVLFLTFLTAACDSASTPDPAADRQAIAAATARFQAAENAGSVDQFRVHFADDLVMMAPDKPPVTGADSVAALMRVFHQAFTVQVEYSSQEIVVFGDWGFDRGTERYTLTPKAGGAPIQKSGNYLYLYKRQEDGSWKQSRVIWN